MAKLYSIIRIPDLSTQHLFKLHPFLYVKHIILHTFFLPFTSPISVTSTNQDTYLSPDDPNITNLMVSHYDCQKQHNLRQFNLLNVQQCTEAPSNIQHANVKARVYVRAKAKRIKAYKCVAYAKKERKFVFKALLYTDVLIELYGTIILCHFLSHLILLNVKTLSDT